MAVYVDDVRHPFRGMIMCHLWADSHDELMSMVDRIGVSRRWLQQPPKASWVHFDIALSKKALAIKAGAILTDRFGPVEFTAGQAIAAEVDAIAAGVSVPASVAIAARRARLKLEQIAEIRARERSEIVDDHSEGGSSSSPAARQGGLGI